MPTHTPPDEMGMGKTIEVLSLLLARRDMQLGRFPDTRFSPDKTCVARERRRPRPLPAHHDATLVVCPVTVVSQWADEVLQFSVPGALKVLCHYGSDRVAHADDLAPYHVVVTSFETLVSEALTLGIRPNKTATGDADQLPYVKGHVTRRTKAHAQPVLFGVHWGRVVLDEAHAIKNHATEVAQATFCLSATHRWCLTGTPIQNSLQDLYSLFKFLQHQPWAESGWWKRVIADPYEHGDPAALPRLKVRSSFPSLSGFVCWLALFA